MSKVKNGGLDQYGKVLSLNVERVNSYSTSHAPVYTIALSFSALMLLVGNSEATRAVSK